MAEKPHSDWDNLWDSQGAMQWDYLSQVVFDVLRKEIVTPAGKLMLEAGSGSGSISLRLEEDNARVYLLDNSSQAIDLSRKVFQGSGHSARVTRASIFQIPYRDNVFDVVWNSGVIEHFVGEEQGLALREMMRVCKSSGLVITLNPYAESILHTLGTFLICRLTKYPYADEVPVRSLKGNIAALGGKLKREEFSVGFILLGVGMFKRLILLPQGKIFEPLLSLLNRFFCRLDNSPVAGALRKLDLWLSRVFGGYLLVTVFTKA